MRSYSVMWVLCCSIGLTLHRASAQTNMNACPLFGTESTELSRSTQERIFLNFEAPSQCRGNVTSWRFCYYRPNIDDDDDDDDSEDDSEDDNDNLLFRALFIIYRRSSPSSNNYQPVSGSITVVGVRYRDMSRFGCLNQPITQQFEIQENDIVGACIQDVSNINPLYIIGDSGDSNRNHKLYQLNRGSYQQCRSDQIASVDTSHSDFRRRDRYTMHLYANIVSAADDTCRVGNNPPSSIARTDNLNGTYLNIQNPAICSNHITKWKYCYYTSATTAGETYTMTVATWSFNSTANTYHLTEGSNHSITLQPTETLPKIFCKEEILDSSEYIYVNVGDIIGVVLPLRNPIPLVSSNSGSSFSLLKHSENTIARDLLNSELTTLSQTALHLHTNLEFVPIPTLLPTTEQETETMGTDMTTGSTNTMETAITTETTNSMRIDISTGSTNTMETAEITVLLPTTRENDTIITANINEGSAELEAGDVFAIIFSIVVLAIIFIAVTLLFIYWTRKKSTRISKLSGQVYYSGIDSIVHLSAAGIKLDEEGIYETIVEPYIYSEPTSIHVVNNDHYSLQESMQDYKEQLDEVKRGTISSRFEDPYHNPASDETAIYTQLRQQGIRNIPGETIEIGELLGSGQFGTINKATWNQAPNKSMDVAIKSLNMNASMIDRIKFLQEAAIMAQFKHPNVVALYGVSNKGGKRMIIVELLLKGDLQLYLQSLKPDPGELVHQSMPLMLLQFSQQICLGMNYLAEKGFVHRDLAARNILVAENSLCKIADFGMSRDLQDTDYYISSGGKIPLKWTAIEAITYNKYSNASDVWSYGCVLYEIWSLGTKPYSTISNLETLMTLKSGIRLAPPPGCPKRIYELMMLCWAEEPNCRPNFREILLSLLENEDAVLNIPPEAATSNPQATVLGAPLEAGNNMYTDIQNKYKQ